VTVHNHGVDPSCKETRLPDGRLRGACLETDDEGTFTDAFAEWVGRAWVPAPRSDLPADEPHDHAGTAWESPSAEREAETAYEARLERQGRWLE
jgi:hypothetical protein